MNFASASNIFFWESVEKWQEVLFLGGFEKKTRQGNKDVQKHEETPFKDDAYESYWEERLKSARLLRIAEESRTNSRGRGRACPRGRARGRVRGAK